MRITDPAELPVRSALLLDTHVWVWLATGAADKLSGAVVDALERAARDERLFASTFSIWEIALKAEKGELLVAADLHAWVREQREEPGVRLVGMPPFLAIDVTRLPPWIRRRDGRPHRDPNDRFLVATARRRNAVLVTGDDVILDYAAQDHVTALDARP